MRPNHGARVLTPKLETRNQRPREGKVSALELHSNLYPTVRGPLGPPGELFTTTDTGSKSWSRTRTRAWGKVKLHLPSGPPPAPG